MSAEQHITSGKRRISITFDHFIVSRLYFQLNEYDID